MNQKLLFAALVVLLVVLAVHGQTSGTPAAEPTAAHNASASPLATMDLTKVFKQHERFADRSEKMRLEVTAAEDALKVERDAYKELATKLESLKPNTDEHRRITAELKKTAEDLNARVARQKEAFLRQEATIYIETYEEIQAAINEYATRRGIKLVLRFNGEPVDRTKPEEVLKELNKSVLFQEGIDITNDILAMVNGRG